MTPTAPISAPTSSSGLARSETASGLGFTDNIEAAFEQSTSGKVRAKIVPEQVLDVPYYVNVLVPTAGGTGAVSKQTHLEADLTRGALEFLMEDTGLKEIEVLGPADAAGSGGGGSGGNGTGGGTPPTVPKAGFFERNWPWILGGGAALLVGAQLVARGGRRRMAEAAGQVQPSRANPDAPYKVRVDVDQTDLARPSKAEADGLRGELIDTWKEMGGDMGSQVSPETFLEGTGMGGVHAEFPFGSEEEARRFKQAAQKIMQVNTGGSYQEDDPGDFEVQIRGGAGGEEGVEEEAENALEAGEAAMEELEEETEEAIPELLDERDNPSGSNDSADYWIARATVDKEEMDQGNVHRTSMASNLASLEMEDQRRIASDLAVAPGGRVTVWKNTSDGLKKQRAFRWSPDNGFSPTG
jgi:hypothetical protein